MPTFSKSMALVGSGSALPELSLTNDQLALRVETNGTWIRSRTGIGKRRVIAPGESLTSLSASAALSAIEMAGWEPETVDPTPEPQLSGLWTATSPNSVPVETGHPTRPCWPAGNNCADLAVYQRILRVPDSLRQ